MPAPSLKNAKIYLLESNEDQVEVDHPEETQIIFVVKGEKPKNLPMPHGTYYVRCAGMVNGFTGKPLDGAHFPVAIVVVPDGATSSWLDISSEEATAFLEMTAVARGKPSMRLN